PDDVVAIGRQALEMTVLLAAPVLLTSLVVGVLISIFQAVTQIQEQTLSFVPKFLAVIVVFLVTLPWSMDLLIRYTTELFLSFKKFAG
ncbi:MAG: flagellar biosynthesis protein FliQ, partial [Deltaproteobacteria bacterium]|nr:flagellar biosynthesis protein FliQ [Deltaproteobacteria bacterium]